MYIAHVQISFLVLIVFQQLRLFSLALRDRLVDASFIADTNSVKLILDEDPNLLSSFLPVNISHVDEHGRTALLLCGLDPQAEPYEVDQNCVNIAERLKKAGADMSHEDNYGLNAVHYGSIRGMKKYISYLIDIGISMDTKDYEGRTPLMKSVAHGFAETFDLLASKGANISAADKDGLTCLHMAVRLASTNENFTPLLSSVLKYAYAKPLALDMKDFMGRTPLMYAALGKSVKTLQILLDLGVDPTLQDNFNISAIHMTNNREMYALIAESSAIFSERQHMQWKSLAKRASKKDYREPSR